MAASGKRKLTITGQKELARWTPEGKDEETVIYEVAAVNEQGEVLDLPLRTFHPDLEQGTLTEFNVEVYDHEKYGRTYTLKLPGKGRASKKDISDMRQQLTSLANRVGSLEEEVAELRRKVNREEKLDEKFGGEDDIPF